MKRPLEKVFYYEGGRDLVRTLLITSQAEFVILIGNLHVRHSINLTT
jgi:hypothetical protein